VFVSREAAILHADADCFHASVEQRDRPELRGRPVIVGPGVVTSPSYEARAYGVRSAMGGRLARRLCPQAVFVKPRWDAYVEAGKALFEVFERTAPVVEGLSMEEAFLDVSGLRRISGSPIEIAARLRREVRERVGLPITVGVGRTKLVAKVASGVAKPDGLLVVPPASELAFLHALRVESLWGVGPSTAEKLNAHGISTVGQAARLSQAELISILGRASGRSVHALAHNRHPERVRARRGRGSFGAQSALGRTTRSADAIDVVVIGLVDRVTRRMRAAGRAGRTVVLRMRFGDFSRATRSYTLSRATAASETVLAAMRALLRSVATVIERKGLTLVGVTVSNLDARYGGIQLELPLERRSRSALDRALDELRERFGTGAIIRAALLGRGSELSPALLADEAARRRD
jgi:DNA polymerase IV